jgi:hypothetical protein
MAASRKAQPEPVPDMLIALALLTRRAQAAAVAAAQVAAAAAVVPTDEPIGAPRGDTMTMTTDVTDAPGGPHPGGPAPARGALGPS